MVGVQTVALTETAQLEVLVVAVLEMALALLGAQETHLLPPRRKVMLAVTEF
jgi:uncharacterized membrane protein